MKITRWDDYLDEVINEFDKVDERSIRLVVRHGLMRVASFSRTGMDLMIRSSINDIYYYIGRRPSQTKQLYNKRMIIGLRVKIRLLYHYRRTPYNGYMYFGLNKEQYEQFFKGVYPPTLTLYKVHGESETHWKTPYQFRIPFEDPLRFREYTTNLDLSTAEYIKEIITYETTNE